MAKPFQWVHHRDPSRRDILLRTNTGITVWYDPLEAELSASCRHFIHIIEVEPPHRGRMSKTTLDCALQLLIQRNRSDLTPLAREYGV